MKVVIIAEKTSAAVRIASSLADSSVKREKIGSGYVLRFEKENSQYSVLPLRGHIIEIDFPEKYNNWKLDKLKEMVYERPVERVKIKGIDNILRKLSAESNLVIIATDYDREGELIGVEALRIMEREDGVKRAKFSALTKSELLDSFNNLSEVDYNLAGSAESRQVIDLIWGAILTRFFSIETKRLGKEFISVGRVQSPTLGILVDRETEIRDFIPETYYELYLLYRGLKFTYTGNPIKNEDEANDLLKRVKSEKKGMVSGVEEKERTIYRPIPFSTTEFLKEANKMGISVERAMGIAETLYQQGKISYPRTDNTVYPRTISTKNVLTSLENSYLKKEIQTLVKESKLVPSRGKVETTDHPPIYPVAPIRKDELKGDYFRIYDLIARRFLATLAENGIANEKNYTVKVNNLEFNYTSSVLVKEGWMKYYPFIYYQEKEDPDLSKGSELVYDDALIDTKQTTPPPRYSQGALVEKMEKLMLGTKSTRHDIIQKLYDRGFIEGNPIIVKPLGMALVESLLLNSVDIVKPEMTAKLENEMDLIASGKKEKEEVIQDSRLMLEKLIDDLLNKAGKIGEKFNETLKKERKVATCPKCGSDLIIDNGKNYRFIKCVGPSNDFFYFLPRTGKIEITDQKCPECGLFLIKVIRKGQKPELRCVDPKCKYNSSRENFGKCPSDGGNLILRRSRMGTKFVGCSNYPKCTVTLSIPQNIEIIPTDEVCSVDGYPIAIFKYKGKEVKQCLNPKCPSRHGTGD
ncbi:MAG: DNA topoisomerase I [Thermoplasmata archaeon]